MNCGLHESVNIELMRYISKYKKDINKLKNIVKNSYSCADVLRKYDMCTKGDNPRKLKIFLDEQNIDYSHFRSPKDYLVPFKGKTTVEDVILFNKPVSSTYKLKLKLIDIGYKENKCEQCGITEWNGKHLNMHLHHIDGNHNNNSLDNLQILCPNCHAQTNNYCGKNIKRIKNNEEKLYNRREYEQNILNLWHKGLLVKDIANKENLCPETVSNILKKNNITKDEIKSRASRNNISKKACEQCKKVIMINIKTNELLQEFNSIKSAAEFISGIKNNNAKYVAKNIAQVCKGKSVSAYGYKWAFI